MKAVIALALLHLHCSAAFSTGSWTAISCRSCLAVDSTSPFKRRITSVPLNMVESEKSDEQGRNLPFILDPNTKGGALFLSLVLFVVPILLYNVVTSVLGFDETQAGIVIGVGFTAIAMIGWVSSYLVRVATKDMTYVSGLLALFLAHVISRQSN